MLVFVGVTATFVAVTIKINYKDYSGFGGYFVFEILQILLLLCGLTQFFKGALGDPGLPESIYIQATFERYGRNYAD